MGLSYTGGSNQPLWYYHVLIIHCTNMDYIGMPIMTIILLFLILNHLVDGADQL